MIELPIVGTIARILGRIFRRDQRGSFNQSVGSGAAGVQFQGSHNSVSVQTTPILPALDERHTRLREPTTIRELLAADIRATTLVGRELELSSLETWLLSTRRTAVRCITGPSGAGKTRLAIELCEGAVRLGWLAGFASPDTLRVLKEAGLRSKTLWNQPALLVLDDAASAVAILRGWLLQIAGLPESGPPIRVLLLERAAAREHGWWQELIRPGSLSSSVEVRSILDPEHALEVPAITSPDARRLLLVQAIALAARLMNIAPVPNLPKVGLYPDFDSFVADPYRSGGPLQLIMWGVLAARSNAQSALTGSFVDTARLLAHSEYDRLKTLAEQRNIDAKLLAHIAACVTFAGGCDFGAAVQLVREESVRMDYPLSVSAETIVEVLADALPNASDTGIAPIGPDTIGEAFIAGQLVGAMRSVDVELSIVERSYKRSPIVTTRTIIHIIQDFADDTEADRGTAWFDHIATLATDLTTLTEIASTLPQRTLGLQRRALAICHTITERLAADALHDRSVRGELARWMNTEVTHLIELGRFDEALSRSLRVVALRRNLAAEAPTRESRAKLAWSLNNLASCYDHVGHHREAYQTAREAVAASAELAAEEPGSDLYHSQYVKALINAANQSEAVEPPKVAFDLAYRAVNLLQQRSDGRIVNPGDCAAALESVSRPLVLMRRYRTALKVRQKVTKLFRKLHTVKPDVHRHDFVLALYNEALAFARLGRYEDAVKLFDETLELLEPMIASRIETYRPKFIDAMGQKARVLDLLGRPLEAAQVRAKARTI